MKKTLTKEELWEVLKMPPLTRKERAELRIIEQVRQMEARMKAYEKNRKV